MKNTTLIETLKNQLEEITKEHREYLKGRGFFKNFYILDFDDEEQAINSILECDGSNWSEGENTAYEQGQREMLQNIIWDLEKEK